MRIRKRGAHRRRWPNHKMPPHDWGIAETHRLRKRERGDVRQMLRAAWDAEDMRGLSK